MKEYKICRDVLHKLWSREVYNVEANSEEEAYEIMIKQSEICKKDVTSDLEDDSRIKFDECFPIIETDVDLSPEDNNGKPTIEIINNNLKVVWDNVYGEKNVKLKVLEKYFKEHLNKNLVFITDKDSFIGSDKHIYKVYSSQELDDKLNYYSDLLSTHIYNEALLLCKKYGLGNYTKYITINKEMIDHEVDNMDLCGILGIYEVLEKKYSYNGDTYTICKI